MLTALRLAHATFPFWIGPFSLMVVLPSFLYRKGLI